ncbi:uncharacterized protein LOC117282203 [Cryptotermes secundus]|uniref:uncharacterized protein LOC117282203 n=1 Tax=Cryptotermes secundus TaxID=105785 RepID=UPI001454DA46|nr:uncharacterized protein LOC117282203 [Cryptotermes secundus]
MANRTLSSRTVALKEDGVEFSAGESDGDRPSEHYYRTIRRTRRLRLKPNASDGEYIIPRSWKSIWLDYATEVLRNTTIQGFVHFTYNRRHPLEHLFWFLCIAVAVGCVATLNMSTWTRYRDSPTVISMENNYRDWNISFVSVYICPDRTVNETRLKATSEERANSTESNDVERLKRFLTALAGLTHENLKDLKEFAGYTLIHPSEYLDLVHKVLYYYNRLCCS